MLMAGHTFLYTAAVNKMKQLISTGELGHIYYISTIRVNLGLFQSDVNVVWDLAPHDVSIMTYLVQSEPAWVSAMGEPGRGWRMLMSAAVAALAAASKIISREASRSSRVSLG